MGQSKHGRVERRVLRRSGGGREVAEVEVWMDGGMECVVLRRSRSRWKGQRGDGVQEEVNGSDKERKTTSKQNNKKEKNQRQEGKKQQETTEDRERKNPKQSQNE